MHYGFFVKLITVSNSSCGKVMFSQECIKNYVHNGEGVSAFLHAGIHLPGRHPLTLCQHPPGQTPLLDRYPLPVISPIITHVFVIVERVLLRVANIPSLRSP